MIHYVSRCPMSLLGSIQGTIKDFTYGAVDLFYTL
jgi:hypothetical protein